MPPQSQIRRRYLEIIRSQARAALIARSAGFLALGCTVTTMDELRERRAERDLSAYLARYAAKRKGRARP